MIDTEALSCQELVELVTDYLEGALSPGDLVRFERHIAACDGCTRYVDQLRATIRATGTITVDDLSPEAERRCSRPSGTRRPAASAERLVELDAVDEHPGVARCRNAAAVVGSPSIGDATFARARHRHAHGRGHTPSRLA